MSNGWTEKALGQLVVFQSGGTPSRGRPEYWEGTLPWLSAKDMKSFKVYDTEDHLTETGASMAPRIVPKGTTLILTRGMTLLQDVPICVSQTPMAFNQDVKALIPHEGLDAGFLPYLLLGNKTRLLGSVELAGHGTGKLDSDVLRKLQVHVPPLPEQRAIAHILGTLNDKIELNRRMNQTLEAIARALFRSWFVDFDPVHAKAASRQPEGINPEMAALFPGAYDAEQGIPQGWEIRPIGDAVTAVGGSTPSTTEATYWGGEFAFATPKDMSSLTSPILTSTERQITDAGLRQIQSGLLPTGTVLMSSRAPIGYLAITEIPVAINQGIIAMICNRELPNYYVLAWAQQNMDAIIANANGTTFLEISKRNFRPLPVVVPPQPLLDRFAESVAPLYERMAANLQEAQTLAQLRDTLVPRLLSGEVRVSEFAQRSEE